MNLKIEMFLTLDDEGYRAVCEVDGEEVARSCAYNDPAIALLDVKRMTQAIHDTDATVTVHESVPLEVH